VSTQWQEFDFETSRDEILISFGIVVKWSRKMCHRDFAKAIKCSFWKIMMDHCDSGTVIPDIHVFYLMVFLFFYGGSIKYLYYCHDFSYLFSFQLRFF
jgi:hypothetical protein